MKFVRKTTVDYPVSLRTGESYRSLAKRMKMNFGQIHKILNDKVLVSEKLAARIIDKLEGIRNSPRT